LRHGGSLLRWAQDQASAGDPSDGRRTEEGRMRRILATLSIVALVVFGCTGSGGGGATTAPRPRPAPTAAPRPSPTLTVEQILANLDHSRIQNLSKDTSTSSIVDWPTFKTGTLTLPQKSQLCSALDIQGADDVFAGIAAAALNFISLETRKKPLPKDFEDALGIAVGVAFKSCPAWQPLLLPTPPPPWYPEGYRLVIGDPAVAWDWADPTSCPTGYDRCWWMDVVARDGCLTSLDASILIFDADGIAIERGGPFVSDPVAPGQTIRFQFGAPLLGKTARAEFINCR
jgi:hypothetical protein